jgi:hypothetical protein
MTTLKQAAECAGIAAQIAVLWLCCTILQLIGLSDSEEDDTIEAI